MSSVLSQIADTLETAAGITTSANATETGYWLRIAAAAEELAGAATTANATVSGYQLRTALALEALAGTSGAEENATESGYLKRIVEALETENGETYSGSWMERLWLAVADYSAAPPAAMLIGSRFNQMGFNGYVGSNGTDTDGNTRISVYNETGATVTHIKAILANWFANATNEQDGYDDITVKLQVEYPAGSFQSFLFSTASSVAIPPTHPDNLVESDELALINPIPDAAQHWYRSWVQVEPGGKWVQGYLMQASSPNLGEAADFSTGVDKSGGGTITNQTGANRRGYGPVAVLATQWDGIPVSKSFVAIGHSHVMGSTDVAESGATAHGNFGYFAKACAGHYPVVNLGIAGQQAQNNLAANMPRRLALMTAIAPRIVFLALDHNDIAAGRSAADLTGDIASIAGSIKAAVPGVKVVVPTCSPKTTGTFLTAAGQTVAGGGYSGGVRATYNANVRAGIADVDTYFELADLVEVDASNVLTRDGNYWISGNAGVGADNVHLADTGATAAAATDGLHPSLTSTTAPVFGGVPILRDGVRAVFDGW